MASETAKDVYRRLGRVQDELRRAQNELVELRSLLARLGLEDAPAEPATPRRRRTGWRRIRGSHSHSYVEDPLGTDEAPEWAAQRAIEG